MKLKLSLLLLSAAVISYQLLLLHTLSITQWYHFASMIISVALLGFGASGTFISLFRNKLLRNRDFYYFLFICLTTLFMIISFRISQHRDVSFDSFLVFSSWNDLSKLLINYLLLFIPFFFAASAIGLLFCSEPSKIGNIYFINLVGSGIGGLIILFILNFLTPQQAIAAIVFLPLTAAILSLVKKHINYLLIIALIIITVINLLLPVSLYLSEFKSLSKVLQLPDSEIVVEDTSPYGLLQIVESPHIRYAPGLSLNYTGESGIDGVVFNNGNWIGPLFKIDEHFNFFNNSTIVLPYIMQSGENSSLVLESGSGELVKLSLQNKIERITAIESNSALIKTLTDYNVSSSASPSVYNHPSVNYISQDPYAFLLTNKKQFDIIHLPLYDSFGGASGMAAAQEKPLLSKEAFNNMWNSLDSNGIITISAWIDTPLRYPLRIAATLKELLVENKVNSPQEHIVAIRNWSLITFAVSKRPIDYDTISRIESFCDEMAFDILLMPNIESFDREKYNYLTDKSLIKFVDNIVYNKGELLSDYPFNVKPVTNNNPFPFQFIKISELNNLLNQYTLFDLPYLEIGYFIILITFILVIILAGLFIITPLLFTKKMASGKLKTFIYFTSLGIGFLFVEIVLIQRFITYLGTPLYSSAVIISSILLFSGLGSNCTHFFTGYINKKFPVSNKSHFYVILSVIVFLILLTSFIINIIIPLTISLPFILKVVIAILIIAPLAFLMGFPFPMGISNLDSTGNQNNISWAWAINGSMSVISSISAVIIAIQYGFFAVILIAACFYGLALLSVLLLND